MKPKQLMLTALKEKNKEGLARLLEQEGFELEINPSEDLAGHSQKVSHTLSIRGRSFRAGHISPHVGTYYEDLNDHKREYENGFIRQRCSDERAEIVAYGVVENVFDPTKKAEIELRCPRHFFWYDKISPPNELEKEYDDMLKETEKLVNSGKIGQKAAYIRVGKGAIRRVMKTIVTEGYKDLSEMLKVNAFYAPGNPAECYCFDDSGFLCISKMVPTGVPVGTVLAVIGGIGAYNLYGSDYPIWATGIVGLSYLLGKEPTMEAVEMWRDRYNNGNIQSSNRISKFDMAGGKSYKTGWYGKKAINKIFD